MSFFSFPSTAVFARFGKPEKLKSGLKKRLTELERQAKIRTSSGMTLSLPKKERSVLPNLFDDGREAERGGVERMLRNMRPEPCIYVIYTITERAPRSQTAGSLKTVRIVKSVSVVRYTKHYDN